MAGLTSSGELRGQFSAIAKVRWRMFVNGLRTLRGRLDLVARGFAFFGFGALALIGAFVLGALACFFISQGRAGWIALLLWIVFLFWQLFPVMASAFTEKVDSSNLLRFPLTFRSYFVVRLAYGSFDPATLVGAFWMLGLAVGIGVAGPALFLWAVPVLIAFVLFNILLASMIFVWLERWLAQRRTREILGVVFFLFIISFQFIGPIVSHYAGHKKVPGASQWIVQILPYERVFPPGLAAASISEAFHGNLGVALGSFALECAYCLAIVWLLNIRLRAQYQGENLSEAVVRTTSRVDKKTLHAGWDIPIVSQPVAAILEKEFRYLSRSGPMLFTLFMPVVILLIFKVSPGATGHQGQLFARAPAFAFPVGAAYSLLVLANFIYNVLGADTMGAQLFYVSPVPFREILLAKNLAHSLVLAMEMILVWLAVCFMFSPPTPDITLATITGVAFALLVNLSAGNLLSIYAPKRLDLAAFGKQRASTPAALLSLLVQVVIFALGAGALFIARSYGKMWLAAAIFLVLTGIAAAVYMVILNRASQVAWQRRDQILAELCRA